MQLVDRGDRLRRTQIDFPQMGVQRERIDAVLAHATAEHLHLPRQADDRPLEIVGQCSQEHISRRKRDLECARTLGDERLELAVLGNAGPLAPGVHAGYRADREKERQAAKPPRRPPWWSDRQLDGSPGAVPHAGRI